MLDQTPVQIAWATADLAVSGRNIYADFVEQYGAGLRYIWFAHVSAEGSGVVSAESSGVPYIDITAIPPAIHAFFDQIKRVNA